jgi:hypothetical protein
LAFTLKALAKITENAGIGKVCVHGKLGFTLPAKVLFSGLHRAVAGCDCHGTDVDARAAHFAEIRTSAEWEINVSILPPTDKTNRLRLP